jgi:hypothetical protein
LTRARTTARSRVKRDRAVKTKDVARSRVVLISASVDADQVPKFTHAEMAVIASEPLLFHDLGMTAHNRGRDYGKALPPRSLATRRGSR